MASFLRGLKKYYNIFNKFCVIQGGRLKNKIYLHFETKI
jgi:hypothetical protein